MNAEAIPLKHIPNILIVDDVPANLKVLGDILRSEGYKVRPVPNGPLALQVAEVEKPDLVLLDIMMPEMDGYEVCKKFKENPKLSEVPIIFISALYETSNIVKAFVTGGVDYITKPFQAKEVKARVSTHLKICMQTRELKKLNADKDRFISILAHDLKSPFNALLGLSTLLADNIHSYEQDRIELLAQHINKSAQINFQLLEDLLTWARSQSGKIPFKPQKLNFALICNDVIEKLLLNAKNKNISLTNSADEKVIVFADLDMLKTILRNLISNAIKFTEDGGKIDINASIEDKSVKISVSDTGVGMDEATVNKLFDITQTHTTSGTASESGTGLGLFLCKDFVEAHLGKIWVESEPGKGTVFYFTFPDYVESETAESIQEISPKLDDQIKKLKILIVEDDKPSILIMEEMVQKYANEILYAKTGREAIEMCRLNPDLDLILMDIRMTEMDGYDATKKIRLFNKEVIIIAQTVYAQSGQREKLLEIGCNDYIAKPIDKVLFTELMRKYFGNK